MIPMVEALDPAARTIVQAMLENILKGSALALLVWGVMRCFPKADATTKSAAWGFSLLALLALLLIALGVPLMGDNAARHTVGTERIVVEMPAAPADASESQPPQRVIATIPAPATAGVDPAAAIERPFLELSLPAPWPAVLLFSLLSIAAFNILRVGWSYVGLQQLKRNSWPLDAALEERLSHWQEVLGKARPIRLRASKDISTPLLAGLKDPTILIPEDMAHALSETELDYVLVHELAHLRRRDDWFNLFQAVTEALLFFNPAVRFISSQIGVQREISCDDWVVKVTGDAKPYAACLTRLARLSLARARYFPAASAVAHKSHITRRIEMLLDSRRNPNPRFSRSRLLSLCVGMVAVIAPLVFTSPVISLPGSQEVNKDLTEIVQHTIYGTYPEEERVEILLAIGPACLRDAALKTAYFEAVDSIADDENLRTLLSGLLASSWLGRDLRGELLEAAHQGFSAEDRLAAFLVDNAEYFLGEKALRQQIHRIAKDMASATNRELVFAELPGVATESTGGTSSDSPSQAVAQHRHSHVEDGDAPPSDAQFERYLADLASQDPRARATASFKLGQLRQSAVPAIPQLIDLLVDESLVKRDEALTSRWWGASWENRADTSPAEEASKALLYIGREIEEPLRQALLDPAWEGKERASWALKMVSQFD
ncbi:MAG: M56 family metallopeptidase [Acidobacteriota bacterium]